MQASRKAILMQASHTSASPDLLMCITTVSEHLQDTSGRNNTLRLKTSVSAQRLTTTQKDNCCTLHFLCHLTPSSGCLPFLFQCCVTFSFAFTTSSWVSHVLSFSSKPWHFTSYSQLVLSELGWCFDISQRQHLSRGGMSRPVVAAATRLFKIRPSGWLWYWW